MTNGKDKAPKDNWDKFEIFAKILPAIAVAFIAILGNYYLQNKQKADNNLKLYTQLLANKENSENTLRKDMFFEMLKSFLSPEKSVEGGEQTITKIREKLFSLELLARNFHESLDMKPLFKHVLMEIVRPRINLKEQYHKLRPTVGLFELINVFETIPEIYPDEKEMTEKLGKSVERIIQDYYSDSFLSQEEETLKKSLVKFKGDLMRPDTKIDDEIPKRSDLLFSMINIDELKEVVEKNYQRLKKPTTNANDENGKSKYLLLYMTDKDEFKETLEKIDQRLNEPTDINQNESEKRGDLYEIVKRINKTESITKDEAIQISKLLIPKIKPFYDQTRRGLSHYNRELDRLISIAKRVTRKQGEVLEDVAGKVRLMIPLKGDASNPICTSVRPTDFDQITPGFCPTPDEIKNGFKGYRVDGVKRTGKLYYFDSDGIIDGQSNRYFAVTVRYVYPEWKRVYVEIETSPDRNKYTMWQEVQEKFKERNKKCLAGNLKPDMYKRCLDDMFKDLSEEYEIQVEEETMSQITVGELKQFLKAKLEIDTAKFWLEYFDFPLVDNTYINSLQRYSIVLENFNSGPEGEDESVQIKLLYYPASYAGLKEKSFYNNQLMHNLMKDDFFTKSKESVEYMIGF